MAISIELQFYCAVQVLARLTGHFGGLRPEEFRRENASLYQSAVYHFGSLANAFRQVQREYEFEHFERWEVKVRPFLGQLRDTEIAAVINVEPKRVTLLRRQLKIKPYSRRRELSFAE